MTSLSVSHGESYELYQDNGFRQQSTAVGVTTSWFKWIDMYATYTQGTLPNYYPSPGVNPFLAYDNAASADVTFYPQTHLRLDEIYYYTRLASLHDLPPSSSLPAEVIFTNHLIRSKINYQFTPAYSFRAILDYNTLLPNDQLVSSAYSKLADATLLFTYLPHPGTAFYVGYADTFQNVDYEADALPPLALTNFPGTSTDRQLFVKFSYLLRF
jgi:hypothetical protein